MLKIWFAARNRIAERRRRFELMGDFPWEKSWPEITDTRVRDAFARVRRSDFIPADLRQWSDRDAPLPIGQGQTISQPFVVALMTQALALLPGDKVLEIGTGSGYQTAILCELVASKGEPLGGTIYSVERHPELSQGAAATLESLGYQPHLHVGDGSQGWADAGPYDAVILTAAPSQLPRPLWEQVAKNGRLVAPIGRRSEEQMLWLLRKVNGKMLAESLGAVRFVPLVTPLLDDPAMCIPIENDA